MIGKQVFFSFARFDFTRVWQGKNERRGKGSAGGKEGVRKKKAVLFSLDLNLLSLARALPPPPSQFYPFPSAAKARLV